MKFLNNLLISFLNLFIPLLNNLFIIFLNLFISLIEAKQHPLKASIKRSLHCIAKCVTHTKKLGSTSSTRQENSLKLCINFVINYSYLTKVSKRNIIFDMTKVCKMASLRIFISSVKKWLQMSNLRSRYKSLKGFHRALYHRM